MLLEMLFDVGAQKIDGTTLDTYGMVVTAFLVTDKANRTSITTRLMEFACKKEGNARDLRTSSWTSSYRDTSASSRLPRHDHILVFHPHYYIF